MTICIAKLIAHPKVRMSPMFNLFSPGINNKYSPTVAIKTASHVFKLIFCIFKTNKMNGTMSTLTLVMNADLLAVVIIKPKF